MMWNKKYLLIFNLIVYSVNTQSVMPVIYNKNTTMINTKQKHPEVEEIISVHEADEEFIEKQNNRVDLCTTTIMVIGVIGTLSTLAVNMSYGSLDYIFNKFPDPLTIPRIVITRDRTWSMTGLIYTLAQLLILPISLLVNRALTNRQSTLMRLLLYIINVLGYISILFTLGTLISCVTDNSTGLLEKKWFYSTYGIGTVKEETMQSFYTNFIINNCWYCSLFGNSATPYVLTYYNQVMNEYADTMVAQPPYWETISSWSSSFAPVYLFLIWYPMMFLTMIYASYYYNKSNN